MSKQAPPHSKINCIFVTSATSIQGYTVADALLKASKFSVSALVKDGTHPLAKQLHDRGARIVVGDLDDPDDIRTAMTGCKGVFNVQNSKEYDVNQEKKQGKLVALIAKEFNCLHFIHSNADYSRKVTGIPLSHAEVKSEIADYIKEIELPYTFIYPRIFLQYFLEDFSPKIENEEYIFRLGVKPDKVLGFLDAADIGPIVEQIFENRDVFLHKNMKIAGDFMSMNNFIEIFQKVTGKKARYECASFEDNPELDAMFKAFEKFDFHGGVHLDELKSIHPGMNNVESWLKKSPLMGKPEPEPEPSRV